MNTFIPNITAITTRGSGREYAYIKFLSTLEDTKVICIDYERAKDLYERAKSLGFEIKHICYYTDDKYEVKEYEYRSDV